MRWLLLLVTLLVAADVGAASARLKKVLPHYVDKEGRHMLAPSLYERDAYQAHLRQNPELRTGLRFDVQWKGPRKVPVTLMVELRGARNQEATETRIYTPVRGRGWFSTWSSVGLLGAEYEKFGELVAWRTTLWSGEELLAEQHSFLWTN